MPEPAATARALLHGFFLEHPDGDRSAFEGFRARHLECSAELDRLYTEVEQLRGILNLSPASIIEGMEESLSPESVAWLPMDRRPPRIPGIDITEEIGHGGMGVIWSGRDLELGRPVAVKVLHEKLAGNEASRRRFVVEARVTGQLQHPGILPVYRLGVSGDGLPFLSMKLVRGRTLAQILSERDVTDMVRLKLLTIFKSICETVSYAHSRGVVHRDLKPTNVMVGSFGEVQVLDWGLAKVVHDEESDPDASVITPVSPESPGSDESVAGSVMGTPSYMPPEQASGAVERVSQRSDVFSLGGVLCEILTGRRASARKKQGRLGSLEECGADRELVDLARSCLATDPDDRPADAGEVARRIAEYLTSTERRVEEAGLEAAASRARAEEERKARRWTVALGGALLLAITVASVALRQTWRGRALAAEGTAEALATAQSLFARADYEGSARAANSGFERADPISSAEENPFLALVRNADLMARLDRHRPRVSVWYLHQHSHRRIRTEYRQAFVEHGLDLLTANTADVARYLRDAGIHDLVRPRLDEWAEVEFLIDGWNSTGARQLLASASALDDDAIRREMREIFIETPTLEELLPFLGPERALSLDPSTLILLLDSMTMLGIGEDGGWSSTEASNVHAAIAGVNERHPNDVKALIQLAESSFFAGLKEHDLAGGTLTPRARAYFHESIEYLGAVRNLDPEGGTAWALLGQSYELLGDVQSSDAAYSEAIEIMMWGERGWANGGEANLMALIGEVDRVIEYLEAAVVARPDEGRLWYALAWHLCRSSPPHDVRAVAAARRALELDPDEPEFQAVLGMALYFAGEFGACADALSPLIDDRMGWRHDLGLMKAICLHELGLEDEAGRLGRSMLRKIDSAWPMYSRSVIRRGRELFGH